MSSLVRKKKWDIQVPTPTDDQVQYYLDKWDHLENYQRQESSLNKLFHRTYPLNNEIDDILIKVASLNDFYSTHIFSPFIMAKHIHDLDIDTRLYSHDETLVNDIAKLEVSPDKIINMYSFATKYCSHHVPDFYAINDYYVEEVLKYFRNSDEFCEFKNTDLKYYPSFLTIISKFQKRYCLNKFSVKDIDRYLWQVGKEYFPRTY